MKILCIAKYVVVNLLIVGCVSSFFIIKRQNKVITTLENSAIIYDFSGALADKEDTPNFTTDWFSGNIRSWVHSG